FASQALDNEAIAMVSTSALPVGSYTITASYGGNSIYAANTSGGISQDVTGSAATKLAFTKQPPAAKAGAVLTPAIKVSVEDAGSSVVPGDTSMVSLTIFSGPA